MNRDEIIARSGGEAEVRRRLESMARPGGSRDEISTLRGFGTTFDLTTGRARNWYVAGDGVKRWADNDKPAGDA